MHSFAKKVFPLTNQLGNFFKNGEFFYSLTNQLPKNFQNFHNIFAPLKW